MAPKTQLKQLTMLETFKINDFYHIYQEKKSYHSFPMLIFLMEVQKNRLFTKPPLYVDVVCEWPLNMI